MKNDILEPQEPTHLNISQKRNPAWVHDFIQEAERYGAPEGSTRQSKKTNPFPSYLDFMCDILDTEPTCFEAVVQNKEWVEVMTEEYQSIMKNNVWEIVPKPKGKSVVSSKWIYIDKTYN